MKTKFRIIIFSLFFFLLVVLSGRSAYASNDFETIFYSHYRLLDSGSASVSQEISLINLKPDIYVSEYFLKVSSPDIRDISAWDKIGPLKIREEKEEIYTNIFLTINEKVVGKGQTLSFILKYELPFFAKKEGRLWRVILPGLAPDSLPKDYKIEVKIPTSFGKLAFSSPLPTKEEKSGISILYSFDRSSSAGQGVLLEFGDYQIFDFSFKYQLSNQNDFSVIQEVTLPPDTINQRVFYSRINPAPSNITKDVDGNWLAGFKLEPKKTVEITAEGQVKIFPPSGNLIKDAADPNQYLKEDVFWEVNDPKIKEIAQSLKNPRDVYDYVIKTLEYNYELINTKRGRKGALGALKDPKNSLCTEFTDLFVSLARAIGIPTREIEGFAFTNNPKLKQLSIDYDILHSWPEFYDNQNKTWKMVDPTWGKTTAGFDYFNNFDTSHFTFVIHGVDSESPSPAGSFSYKNEPTKNISVKLALNQTEEKISLDPRFSFGNGNFFNKYLLGRLIIRNRGPAAVYDQKIELINSEGFSPVLDQNDLPVLLPFGEIEIPLKIKNPDYLFDRFNLKALQIKIGDEVFARELVFHSTSKQVLTRFGLLTCLIITSLLLIIIREKRHFDVKIEKKRE